MNQTRWMAALLAGSLLGGCREKGGSPPAVYEPLVGARVVAESLIAGYQVRRLTLNGTDYVAIAERGTIRWRAGDPGDSTVEMAYGATAACPLTTHPWMAAGFDATHDGTPDLMVTEGDGLMCETCVTVSMVELTRPLRIHRVAFTDSVAVRDLDGDGVPELVLTDVTMNELGVAQVRPRVIFRYHDGDYRVAADLMRTAAPDSAALDAAARSIMAAVDDESHHAGSALWDAMARLVAGGNEAAAWGLMRRVVTTDSTRADNAKAFRDRMAQSSLRGMLRP